MVDIRPSLRTPDGYLHGEAFKLMKYRPSQRATGVPVNVTVSEHVWNSRDGVTPFMIGSHPTKLGPEWADVEWEHVEWKLDRLEPYWPHMGLKVGDRIFLDLTMERALEIAKRQFDRSKLAFPGTDVETPEEIEQLLKDMAQSWIDNGDPDIVVVDEKLLAHLQRHCPKPRNWTERTGHSGRYG